MRNTECNIIFVECLSCLDFAVGDILYFGEEEKKKKRREEKKRKEKMKDEKCFG